MKGEDEGANGEKIDPNVRYEGGSNMTALHMAAMNDELATSFALTYGGAVTNNSPVVLIACRCFSGMGQTRI